MKVKFGEWNCETRVGRYANGRIGIELIDVEDGSPVAKATVNLVDQELNAGEICVKDWSENAGMVEALVAAGICSEPIRNVASGYVVAPVCKLLVDFDE